jgi:Glyoxalase/Bleomycin resistance protein/Dioxygenase superfamily
VPASDGLIGRLGPYWHVGIVVADVEQSASAFSRALGCRWGAPREVAARMWTPSGELDVRLTYTYSTGPEPRIELVSGSPGSPWDPVHHSGVDHVCYWSDDVTADSRSLAAEGMGLVVRHAGPVAGGFVYHEAAVGCRVELMDRGAGHRIRAWLRDEEWDPLTP